MADQGALHLGRADAVTGDLDHVVGPPHEEEIPVLVFAAYVLGGIAVRNGVRIDLIAVWILIDCPHYRGPGYIDNWNDTVIRQLWIACSCDYTAVIATTG